MPSPSPGKRYGVGYTILTQPFNGVSGVGYASTIKVATQRAATAAGIALSGRDGLPSVNVRFDIVERPARKATK